MRNLKHYLVMATLVGVVAILSYYGMTASNLFPAQASAQAIDIDWLFDLQIKLIAFFFALIMVPLGYSLVVFRRKAGDDTDAEHVEGNTPLEITWTFIPLVIVIWLGYIGADNLAKVERIYPDAHEIKVLGYQWGWRFDYPEGFSSNVLYLPVNEPVVLKMESPDVLHSFWVPEFRIKQDLVPGRVTEYRITPIELGDFKVRCAEICGKDHALMENPVKVVTRVEYDLWVKAEAARAEAEAAAGAANPDAGRGQKLYENLGCKACHSLDGAKGVGPSWKGIYGSQRELADGSVVTVNDEYIKESILNPAAKTAAGFTPGSMPASFGNLKEGQLADLIEFIKSLK